MEMKIKCKKMSPSTSGLLIRIRQFHFIYNTMELSSISIFKGNTQNISVSMIRLTNC